MNAQSVVTLCPKEKLQSPPAPAALADGHLDLAPPDQEVEIIGGFRVHPEASKLPLITGALFEEMVEAAREAGRVEPIELSGGWLTDGRNRVRIREELRRRGVEIELPTYEWIPTGNETLAEHIYKVNVLRRHLTDDQRVALAADFLPAIRESRRARQEASRFGGDGSVMAANESSPPVEEGSLAARTSREKDAASTVGQLAAFAHVGIHKARQLLRVVNGVEDGTIDRSELDAVAAGTKPLRAVASLHAASAKKSASRKRDADTDEVTLDALPLLTEEEITRRWEREKQEYPIAEHRELRRLYVKVIAKEQQMYDR